MHSTHIMYYYSRVVVLSTTTTTTTTTTTRVAMHSMHTSSYTCVVCTQYTSVPQP